MAKEKRFRFDTTKIEKLYQKCTLNDRALSWMDAISAFLLAMCPILQHYVGPLYNAAISAMVLIAVYMMYRMIPDVIPFRLSKFSFVLPMVIYQLYRVVNHGTTMTEFGQSMVLVVFMLALTLGKIDTTLVLRIGRVVAVIASLLLIAQYIVFYFFDIHLQLVFTSLLIPAADQWVLGAQTGLAGVTGRIGNFYRPSAFFLEPAHVYLYAFPQVILLLFKEKINKKNLGMAVLISFGIFLSTSGMGIAAVIGIWALFFVLYNEKDGTYNIKNVLRKRNLILMGFLLIVFIIAVQHVPFLSKAIRRVFIPGKTGTTAITGRLRRSMKMVAKMTMWQWVFGVADNTHGIKFHIPGMLDALYRHGLIGLILSYELYIKCICKLNIPYQFIGIVILVTSVFSAHTHSTVGTLFFLLFLFDGFQEPCNAHPKVQSYKGTPLRLEWRKRKQ